MSIKVGLSGDLLNENGSPCFGDDALLKLKKRNDIEIGWIDASISEILQMQ